MLRKKSPANIGTSDSVNKLSGLVSVPTHNTGDGVSQGGRLIRCGFSTMSVCPTCFGLGGRGEQTPEDRNAGKPRESRSECSLTLVCIKPAITAHSPSTSRVMP